MVGMLSEIRSGGNLKITGIANNLVLTFSLFNFSLHDSIIFFASSLKFSYYYSVRSFDVSANESNLDLI